MKYKFRKRMMRKHFMCVLRAYRRAMANVRKIMWDKILSKEPVKPIISTYKPTGKPHFKDKVMRMKRYGVSNDQ